MVLSRVRDAAALSLAGWLRIRCQTPRPKLNRPLHHMPVLKTPRRASSVMTLLLFGRCSTANRATIMYRALDSKRCFHLLYK